jgi:hypothetical protein
MINRLLGFSERSRIGFDYSVGLIWAVDEASTREGIVLHWTPPSLMECRYKKADLLNGIRKSA